MSNPYRTAGIVTPAKALILTHKSASDNEL
jgi:hypothetical protein